MEQLSDVTSVDATWNERVGLNPGCLAGIKPTVYVKSINRRIGTTGCEINMTILRVAVDTGGTFTDFVVLNEDTGAFEVFKVPSTRGHEADGIIDGLKKHLELVGASGSEVKFFCHGTTVGTNAILEENGARTGLLVTEGFRGIYEIGEQSRPYGASTYDLFYQKPKVLVPPKLTEEIRERVLFDGSVHIELDRESALGAIRRMVAHGVESVAVCLLFSFMNSDHERQLGRWFEEFAPDINVSLSCEIIPQIREYYRLSTTVVNAYLNPLMERYLVLLDERLVGLGFLGDQRYIMRSNGGVSGFAVAAQRSVQTILSGPAAGVIAATRVLEASERFENVVTFDMGGTSTDVALIENRTPVRRMGGKVYGRDVLVPMLDIHTVAAGGGTLAWVDGSGVLQVGPQSAGADPGPACYGKGGQQPTITDANVVLGLLSVDTPLAGGAMQVDRNLAFEAVQKYVADPLGLSVVEAARGIIEIVNVKMEEAVKTVSSNRGYDLRDFHLLAFGGAGPLHASSIASDLGMKGAIIPALPGVFSALGLLLSDVRQDYVFSELAGIHRVSAQHVSEAFEKLRVQGERDLLAQGFGEDQLQFEYAFDLRYIGQAYELTVGINEPVRSEADLGAVRVKFDAYHEQLTGHAARDEQVEIVNYRLAAVAKVPQAPIVSPFQRPSEISDAKIGSCETHMGVSNTLTDLYDRTKLAEGSVIRGPAILLQGDSTTVLYPEQTATVVELGMIEIRADAAAP